MTYVRLLVSKVFVLKRTPEEEILLFAPKGAVGVVDTIQCKDGANIIDIMFPKDQVACTSCDINGELWDGIDEGLYHPTSSVLLGIDEVEAISRDYYHSMTTEKEEHPCA